MNIIRIRIENFRALEAIEFEPDQATNVIVGPNAIGKTTILEAIRLQKAMLAPRYFQETQQTLLSLGAIAQNHQFFGTMQVDWSAIARDPANDVKLDTEISLTEKELQILRDNLSNLALGLVRARLGRTDEQAQFALSQYLSTPEGITALEEATKSARDRLTALSSSGRLRLQLTISAGRNSYFGHDVFPQMAFSLLDQRLPAHIAAVSYFPADRAFPPGEVNIQIGSADAANQVQSHLGSPALKYQRLKQTIVHGIITNQIGVDLIKAEFDLILANLVPGKEFGGLSINQLGQLKVLIKDTDTNKMFDIDHMSSGEKGIILTFLLIRHTLADGGLLLIDEPELHLNPAVCRKLLPFLQTHCVESAKLQAFVCTHSPDILAAAFDRSKTNLFHLRSGVDLTKVYPRDKAETYEALRRLGASTADILFSRGTIFVEGEHDAEILNEGFFEILSGYKITQAGGRAEVERELVNLQRAEEKGNVEKTTLFIFDWDRRRTIYKSTKLVRVLQWDRYCLENYLLEPNILFDQVMATASRKPESRGSFIASLKPLAFSQLEGIAVREVYESVTPDNPGIRSSEISGKGLEEVAELLVMRLVRIGEQTRGLDSAAWTASFVGRTRERIAELTKEWELDWAKRCNGKRLIQELYRTHEINLDPLSFKKAVIRQMRSERNERWVEVENLVQSSLA